MAGPCWLIRWLLCRWSGALVCITGHCCSISLGGSDLQVLRLGPMPASRTLERWLAAGRGPQVLISEGDPRPLDPRGRADQWSGGMQAWLAQQSHGSTERNTSWLEADRRLGDLLDELLPCRGPVTEPALARALGQLLPSGLPVMLAASSPVRDWMLWSGAGGSDRRCFSFRGASGIDGTCQPGAGLVVGTNGAAHR